MLVGATAAGSVVGERRATFILHDKPPIADGDSAMDCMDCVMSGSSNTPTVVVTLMMEATAFHLVFDALELGLRPGLQAVHGTAGVA